MLLVYMVARENLHGKISFEQKTEGNEGKLQISGQRAFQAGRGSGECKGPEMRVEEAYSRNKVLGERGRS